MEDLTRALFASWQNGELDNEKIKQIKREWARGKNLKNLPTNADILKTYSHLVAKGEIEQSSGFEQALRKRAIRSLSGIVPIQVLTKPFWCPWECIFCPNDPTMPKSYISSEPWAMRALLNQFDPVRQVYNRLLSLTLTWHPTDKIEMIVLGGTWDVYPRNYKYEFVKGLYDAVNTFPEFREEVKGQNLSRKQLRALSQNIQITWAKDLQQAQQINQKAKHRIIGLTIETRPEYVSDENLIFWRELGVTRVEMGVQSMFDDVLEANKRWHSVKQIREAMDKLRRYGFKISIHIMAGLYGSDLQKDKETFRIIYSDPAMKPDEIKFYPTAVIPNTELYRLWLEGKYQPITPEQIKEIIFEIKQNIIPPWTRIKRLIRDIPSDEVVAGASITNLRQLALSELMQKVNSNSEFRKKQYSRLAGDKLIKVENLDQVVEAEVAPEQTLTFVFDGEFDVGSPRDFVCMCTRCREIRGKDTGLPPFLVIRKYLSSAGQEYFISFEDGLGYLYGFLRLLIPEEGVERDWLGKNSALVREVHVYGQLKSLSEVSFTDGAQHKWFWKRLMETAQKIAKINWKQKISVISGIGVRDYYQNLGYHLEGTYMVKNL